MTPGRTRRMAGVTRTSILVVAAFGGACASFGAKNAPDHPYVSADQRLAILRRAQVWNQTDVASMDLMAGPTGPGSFKPGESVSCQYVVHEIHGDSPKFYCQLGVKEKSGKPDEVKVKYGVTNAEVYGEVASTRLFWALGFGADAMYPVRVVCHGCPATLKAASRTADGDAIFEPAAIERKMPGREIEAKSHEGWSWKELSLVDPAAGGAPLAQRDALKLLAAFVQHGDNKSQQQRLDCEDKSEKGAAADAAPGETGPCERSFMMVSDLGLTFGRSDWLNRNEKEGVNFSRWAGTPVWKNPEGCVAKLSGSFTGSLSDPVISEGGRKFLSDLLQQLTDQQVHDMFAVAQIPTRRSEEHTSEL